MVYRLPQKTAGLAELAEADKLISPPDVLADFGFQRSHIARGGEELTELMLESGRDVMEQAGLSGDSLASLFLYSGLNLCPEPSDNNLDLFRYPLAQAQYELDLGAVPAMALSQRGCCGLLAAVDIAARLLKPGVYPAEVSSVLCLVGDAVPAAGKREIMLNLMSDAAAALLVSRDCPHNRIVAYHEQVQPYYWNTPQRENELLAAYFPVALRVIQGAMKQAGIDIDAVRWFVPHNVSLRSWTILAELLGVPEEKIWTRNIARLGHTVSCDHIINLVDMEQEGALSEGDYLVLFTFGFGASWSCMVLQH